MIVSESKSFIYVRVPKTGSTSVSYALEPYRRAADGSRVGALFRRIFPKTTRSFATNFRAHPHWPIRAARQILPVEMFDSFYKFTVVRDPLRWCVSLHSYVLQNKNKPRFAQFYRDVHENDTSFDYFVSTLLARPIPPQVGLITDIDGRLLVDNVVTVSYTHLTLPTIYSV